MNTFFKNNLSNLLSILIALILFCCLVGPLWSFESHSTTEYGDLSYSLTGEPVYKSIAHVADDDIDSMFGDRRTATICGIIVAFFSLCVLAFSIASLFIGGYTEMCLKYTALACLCTVTVAAMIMMIVVGGEIHSLEQNYGVYGFLVGPGPICSFVFGIVGVVVNGTLIYLKLDGNRFKKERREERKALKNEPITQD